MKNLVKITDSVHNKKIDKLIRVCLPKSPVFLNEIVLLFSFYVCDISDVYFCRKDNYLNLKRSKPVGWMVGQLIALGIISVRQKSKGQRGSGYGTSKNALNIIQGRS